MAMESALVMSHAMGRTLVLPPQHRFDLLGKADSQQKKDFELVLQTLKELRRL